MDLDLKVYIPQRNFEKNLRIATPLITINQLEVQIRDRISDLPQKLTYHKRNDPDSPCLEVGRSLGFYGYGDFFQEAKGLYIFYKDLEIEEKLNVDFVQEVRVEPKASINKSKRKPTTNKKDFIFEDVLITILDPYLATNHTFLVNPMIKMSELIEYYKKRIDWGTRKEKLGLVSLSSNISYSSNESLMEVCRNDSEVTLHVQHLEKKPRQFKKTKSNNVSSDESLDIEVIEKKVKKEVYSIQKKTNHNNGYQKQLTKTLSSDAIEIEEVLTSGDDNSLKSTPTQMLSKITKNFDTLLTLQKVNSKLFKKETPSGNLYSESTPFVIEEDANE